MNRYDRQTLDRIEEKLDALVCYLGPEPEPPPAPAWEDAVEALEELLSAIEMVNPEGMIDGVSEPELVRTGDAPIAISTLRTWAAEVGLQEALDGPLARTELLLKGGEHDAALDELRGAMMGLVEGFDPATATTARMAAVTCAVGWLRDAIDLIAHVEEPEFALSGPSQVSVPLALWEVSQGGVGPGGLVEVCVPMLASLVRYECGYVEGPDLDPEWVRARMLGDGLDDEGERPAWILLAWVLQEGLLGQWWPAITDLTGK